MYGYQNIFEIVIAVYPFFFPLFLLHFVFVTEEMSKISSSIFPLFSCKKYGVIFDA